jgi:hypothetical protein
MVVTTALRDAFARIPVPKLVAPLGDLIVDSLTRGIGQVKHKRAWNANLSYRTYQHLQRKGIMPSV